MDDHPGIHLDGRTLEGGGQLLRLSLSISSLTKIPVHITDIRGNRGSRSKSGADGGMKSAHLAGATWLSTATEAQTEGLALKSRDLVFTPGKSHGDVWKDVFESGKLVRREACISISTPGSVLLILQAILPYVVFSSWPDLSQGKEVSESLIARLTIHGGTNVWHSLSFEYASQVLFHMLYKKLGIGPIKMSLRRRGWSTGKSSGVGEVVVDIPPLRRGMTLPAFSFTDRGDVTEIHVFILANTTALREALKGIVTRLVTGRYPGALIVFDEQESQDPQRLYLLLVAETSNGYRLGRDWLYDSRIDHKNPVKTLKALASKVCNDLESELAHGGCVDEFLQDQLVVFQALAEGRSEVEGGDTSLHTQTAQWVVQRLLGLDFDTAGCDGIGFKAGQDSWPSSQEENITKSMEAISIKK